MKSTQHQHILIFLTILDHDILLMKEVFKKFIFNFKLQTSLIQIIACLTQTFLSSDNLD